MARHGSITTDTLKTNQKIYLQAREWWLLRIASRLSYNAIGKRVGRHFSTVRDYVQVYREYVAKEFPDDLRILDEIASCEYQIAHLETRKQKLEPEDHETALAYTREIRAWTGILHELQGIGEAKSLQPQDLGKNLQKLTGADRKEIYDIANGRRVNSPTQAVEAREQGGA